MMKIKIELELDGNEIKRALQERGLACSKSNMARFARMASKAIVRPGKNLYDNAPTDRLQLLMYGFTFPSNKGNNK